MREYFSFMKPTKELTPDEAYALGLKDGHRKGVTSFAGFLILALIIVKVADSK